MFRKHLSPARYLLLALTTLIAFPGVMAQSETTKPLTFGVVPQQAASKLAGKWIPLLNTLREVSGIEIQFATATDIPTFEQRLLDGEYDLAYMNPYHYVVVHEKVGYQALARARDKKLHGILVVRRDSGITALEELNGQRLAFPSPAAFAASMITRAELRARGIDFSPTYVASHDSVYRGVEAGLFPAGGGVIRTFKTTEDGVRANLKVLWTSPGTTPHAIAAHPRVDTQTVARIREALVGLEQSEGGKRHLDALKIKGLAAAADGEWDDVRALKIDRPIGLLR